MKPIILPVPQSTLTARYQTTIPAVVRKALDLKTSDKIAYEVTEDNQVILTKVSEDSEDKVMQSFLAFLDKDIELNPSHVQPITKGMAEKYMSMIVDVDMDMDEPLPIED